MNRKIYLNLLCACLALFIFVVCGFAQGTTSRLTGTVTDNAGAAVGGATVTLTDEATNTSLTTQTSDSGTYTFDLIQAGTYRVSVEKQGFKKFVTTNNVVNVNQPATVNVGLEIGDVSATVTVESKVEEVQTSSSGNIGSTIEQKTVESLPIVGLRGRNPLDLLTYQPGVNTGANTGGGVHVNGSRDRAFNFTLDGIDINESSAGGSNFTPLRPNPDSIQEFQVVTSNPTAELGRSSGAQVTFVTRSGTNRFSGNVFEYYQTPDFNANEYQNNLNGRAKNQFVQHIFGGSLGGPLFDPGFGEGTKARLLKDKAFFFV
ncbi:MAG: carboxypeptidase regulatory-like domain-containing protein, partial [Pyrinomonadaceae bacterium]